MRNKKPTFDRTDQRLRQAMGGKRGAELGARALPEFAKAARWLEARGFPDAARELARASRGPLNSFWSEARLEALLQAQEPAGAWRQIAGDDDQTRRWNLAALCLTTAQFLAAKGLLLMSESRAAPTAQESVYVNKRVALLAEAVLDVAEPGWRRKIRMLRAIR